MTGSSDKTVRVWQREGMGSVLVWSGEGHKGGVTGVDVHPGSSQPVLVSSSGDNTLKIWDYQQKKVLTTLKEHIQPVWSCAYHDLGHIVLSTSMDHTIKLWDVER